MCLFCGFNWFWGFLDFRDLSADFMSFEFWSLYCILDGLPLHLGCWHNLCWIWILDTFGGFVFVFDFWICCGLGCYRILSFLGLMFTLGLFSLWVVLLAVFRVWVLIRFYVFVFDTCNC